MSDASFFRPLIPEKFRILGLRLKTFSLGHFHLLEGTETAFIWGGQISYEDLVSGVFICSRNWKQNLWWIQHPRLQLLYQLLWQKCVGPFNFTEKCILFSAYLKQALDWPIYRERPGLGGQPQTESTGAPLSSNVRTYLVSQGFNEDKLWDRPWSSCMLDYLTIKAGKGEIEFMDRDKFKEARDIGEKIAEKIRSRELKIPKR